MKCPNVSSILLMRQIKKCFTFGVVFICIYMCIRFMKKYSKCNHYYYCFYLCIFIIRI